MSYKVWAALKVYGPSFKFSIFVSFEESLHSKDVNFKFQLKGSVVWMCETMLYISVAYILIYKLNNGYHNQIRFH